jgi:transposase
VVSDLLRGRPIWFGGLDRSEESMALFFKELGMKKCRGIYLAVMDMWKPFGNAMIAHVPGVRILFDKFHVIAPLGEALDEVRKSEYTRLTGRDRQFIKGQKYTLLSNHANLTLDGRRSLAKLLQANKRLNIAYVLKESFGQLWTYQSEAWARRFFEHWKQALKWQRLKPYEKFARMIDRHWDGIAAYCQPQNKVPLGFVEGLNNKIRVLQRRAYGLRDEEYLRLKVLTCMLPEISTDEPSQIRSEMQRTFDRRERELRLKTRSLLVLIRFGTLKTPQNHPLDTELTVFSTLQRFGFSAVSMEIHLCGDP